MKNCVSRAEGHRERIQGYQTLKKDKQVVRPNDIHGVKFSTHSQLRR
jgi:hypothetical protein